MIDDCLKLLTLTYNFSKHFFSKLIKEISIPNSSILNNTFFIKINYL